MSTRQHKFQVWDKRYRKMYSEGICIYGDGTFDVRRTAEDGNHIETAESQSGDLILREYTGLRDKEGREVYDGDLPGGIWEEHKVQWCHKCHGWSLGLVEVEGHCGQCDGDYMWLDFVDDVNEGKTTIIGNIYEP